MVASQSKRRDNPDPMNSMQPPSVSEPPKTWLAPKPVVEMLAAPVQVVPSAKRSRFGVGALQLTRKANDP